MGFSGSSIHNIGTQYRKTAVTCPTVENGTAGLYVMVTHITGIIPHEIHHLRCQMRGNGIYVIIIIGCGLSLQNVTIVQENQIFAISLTFFLHQSMHTCQTAGCLPAAYKVVGIVVAVYITGLYDFQFHLSFLRRQYACQDKNPDKKTTKSFHYISLFLVGSYKFIGWVNINRAPSV